ncbi:hypothetical protein PTKIN_Ptkin02bG0253100 [Pterospermum kingtungense]
MSRSILPISDGDRIGIVLCQGRLKFSRRRFVNVLRPKMFGTVYVLNEMIALLLIIGFRSNVSLSASEIRWTEPPIDVFKVNFDVAFNRDPFHALEFAADAGFRRVIIKGDSLTVIKALRATEEDLSCIYGIVSDSKASFSNFEQVSFSHVSR